jgi:phosphatidylserine decarboxylase
MSWFSEQLVCLPSRLLPHHALSRLVYRLARSRRPWLKQRLIDRLVRTYRVDMTEAAQSDPRAYPDLVSFFTRALRHGVRPLAGDDSVLVSPADGTVSAYGPIEGDRLFQAKGRSFTLTELLGGSAGVADEFRGGEFCTVYLAPRDYHRVHMPFSGCLRYMRHVPGRLFSVQAATARHIDRVYARNERLVCVFDTAYGPVAVVLVGAMLVSSICTVWAGEINPHGERQRLWKRAYPAQGEGSVQLHRGAELGQFAMGSTVIVLLPPGHLRWDAALRAGSVLRYGEALGQMRSVD